MLLSDNGVKRTQETTHSVDHDSQSDSEYITMNEKQQTI